MRGAGGASGCTPKTNCGTGNRGRKMGDSQRLPGRRQGGCSFSGGVLGPGGSLGPPTPPPHPSHPRLGRAPSGAGVEAQLELGPGGASGPRIPEDQVSSGWRRPTPPHPCRCLGLADGGRRDGARWSLGAPGSASKPRLGSRPVGLSSWSPSSQRWFSSRCAGCQPGCRESPSFPICADGLSEEGQVCVMGPPTHDPPKLEF